MTLQHVLAALADGHALLSAKRRRKGNPPEQRTPRFKSTDDMLNWTLEYEGESDQPAPGIQRKGNTTDSEIPETFGRIAPGPTRGLRRRRKRRHGAQS